MNDLSTVEELDTIYMTLPVEGGKKKKKVYTTKKKNKHRHIKEKLATLKVTKLLYFYLFLVLFCWWKWKSCKK